MSQLAGTWLLSSPKDAVGRFRKLSGLARPSNLASSTLLFPCVYAES